MRITKAGSIAAVGFLSVAAQAPEPRVCDRMAPQIGMKQVYVTRSGADLAEWRVDTASFGQHLVGGTVATSFRIEPIDGARATPDEEQRVRDMCKSTKKGYECALAGPVSVQIGTRRGVAKITLALGERATVGVRGTAVYCRTA